MQQIDDNFNRSVSDGPVFVGVTVTVSTTATQRIAVSLFSTIRADSVVAWGAANACYRTAGSAGPPTPFTAAHAYFQVRTFPTWMPISVHSSAAPGAGTWEVGLCQVYDNTTTATGYLSSAGTVMVVE